MANKWQDWNSNSHNWLNLRYCWTKLPRELALNLMVLARFSLSATFDPAAHCCLLETLRCLYSWGFPFAGVSSASETFSVSSRISSSLAFCPACSVIYHCHQWATLSTSCPSFIHSTNTLCAPPRHVALMWTTVISLHIWSLYCHRGAEETDKNN